MKLKVKFSFLISLILFLGLNGCVSSPFKPQSDIQVNSIRSWAGSDEISPDKAGLSSNNPYHEANIEFSLNNGVGVTITDISITYSPTEGDSIVFVNGDGILQTGIPKQTLKMTRHFDAAIPFTELGQSQVTILQAGTNLGVGEPRICCININLVSPKAAKALSIDGDFQTLPNLGTNIIATVDIAGIDDNDNPFAKTASIVISPDANFTQVQLENEACKTCTIGTSTTFTDPTAGAGATPPTSSS
ncbi:MAG: hypothetical protein COB02_06350 [Candidatus Cloacimonadota bacterium]|nr:MAG: hypothetical protein COB02_06350 [Candidatus Cloacimonadota bacterium]